MKYHIFARNAHTGYLERVAIVRDPVTAMKAVRRARADWPLLEIFAASALAYY